MRRVGIEITNELRIDGNVLGHDIVNEILDELTIENKEKLVAKRMNRWKWEDLPDDFLLADLDGDTLVMPRGYLVQLKLLLADHGFGIQLHDRRKWLRGESFAWRQKFVSREHQVEAVKQMRLHQQGIYEAPTGSGKTLSCVKLIHDLSPTKAIILVDQLGLLNQWIGELNTWLSPGGEVGQIGSGAWIDNKRITVATLQTLWSEFKDLLENGAQVNWFDQFDLVIVDECHHISAKTIQAIVDRFPAKYRLGVSATPDRKDGKFEFALNILGEVFHQDDEEVLRSRGILVKPHVETVKTDFKFAYWTDHESDKDGTCEKPGCNINHKHRHNNNYKQLKSELVGDEDRNQLVVDTIASQLNSNHIHLLITNEVRQLDLIRNMALEHSKLRKLPLLRMTGQTKKNDKNEILIQMRELPQAVLFATVAKEGLDIPRIDRIYLPFPISNPKVTQQSIGRATRVAEGKQDTIIFDFFDVNIEVLKKQFRKRHYQCYNRLGIEVRI